MRKLLTPLIVFALAFTAFRQYRAGYDAGRARTTRYYESVIADRVSSQIQQDRKTMGIREKSAEARGFEKCQEQF